MAGSWVWGLGWQSPGVSGARAAVLSPKHSPLALVFLRSAPLWRREHRTTEGVYVTQRMCVSSSPRCRWGNRLQPSHVHKSRSQWMEGLGLEPGSVGHQTCVLSCAQPAALRLNPGGRLLRDPPQGSLWTQLFLPVCSHDALYWGQSQKHERALHRQSTSQPWTAPALLWAPVTASGKSLPVSHTGLQCGTREVAGKLKLKSGPHCASLLSLTLGLSHPSPHTGFCHIVKLSRPPQLGQGWSVSEEAHGLRGTLVP